MFYIYAIKSLQAEYVYIGHTADLARRLDEHNKRSDKSNSKYKPFVLFYFEEVDTREEAVLREKKLKSGFYRESLRAIAYKDGEVPKWLKGRVC